MSATEKRYRQSEKGKQAFARGAQRYWAKIKNAVFGHYGLCCAHCGFTDSRALSIDHINGGGAKHRRKLGLSGGRQFYYWLLKNKFPSGFQTLCMNCQFIKRVEKKESHK